MTNEEKISFSEPKSFGISKYRLLYSTAGVTAIVVTMILNKESTPLICFGLAALPVIYLFLPLLYRLVISDEAISSIDHFSAKTLEWNDVAEIGIRNGNLILSNQDGDVRVAVKQQIDDYPNIIKFIKQQRPDLWRLDGLHSFHQGYLESAFSLLMGLGAFAAGIMTLFDKDLTIDMIFPVLLIFSVSTAFVLNGLMRIRKLSLDGENLVVQYLFWKRQLHVKDVWFVSLEPKFGQTISVYEVRIRVRNKKDIVVQNIVEGNPILVGAIENWMNKYKG